MPVIHRIPTRGYSLPDGTRHRIPTIGYSFTTPEPVVAARLLDKSLDAQLEDDSLAARLLDKTRTARLQEHT